MKTVTRIALTLLIGSALFPSFTANAGRESRKATSYLTVENYPFCTTKSDLFLMLRLKEQNDTEAMARLVLAGRCDLLKPALPVFLMEVDKPNSLVKIRLKGLTESVWTSAFGITKEPAKFAEHNAEMDKIAKAADEIEETINSILSSKTRTSCLPAGNKDSSISLLVVGDDKIFSTPTRKKAWLLTCAGVAGSFSNENPKIKFNTMAMTDSEMIQEGKVFVIPMETAKKLQRQIKAGQITLEQMYAELLSRGSFEIYTPPTEK